MARGLIRGLVPVVGLMLVVACSSGNSQPAPAPLAANAACTARLRASSQMPASFFSAPWQGG